MVYHGLSCVIMIYHDLSWSITIFPVKLPCHGHYTNLYVLKMRSELSKITNQWLPPRAADFFPGFHLFGGASRAPKSPINIKVWMEYLQINMGFRLIISIVYIYIRVYIYMYIYVYMGYKPFTNWFSVTLGWLDTLIHFIRGWPAKKYVETSGLC